MTSRPTNSSADGAFGQHVQRWKEGVRSVTRAVVPMRATGGVEGILAAALRAAVAEGLDPFQLGATWARYEGAPAKALEPLKFDHWMASGCPAPREQRPPGDAAYSPPPVSQRQSDEVTKHDVEGWGEDPRKYGIDPAAPPAGTAKTHPYRRAKEA